MGAQFILNLQYEIIISTHQRRPCHMNKIFLTGSTGTMGLATLKELLGRKNNFVIALVFDSKKDKKIIRKYKNHKNLEIIYGDLRDKSLIERCIKDIDFILHIGALVSPMADKVPELAMETNYGSALNIIDAVKKQSNSDEIGVVFTHSVAMTGCRLPPIHWGRVGDPIKVSMFDYYAVGKVASERALFESGLAKWVSVRQSGMLPINKEAAGGIISHQNLNNVLEWSTAEESGRLMANICETWIPNSFWRHAYNIGGGEKYRFTSWQFFDKSFEGVGRCRDIIDPRQSAIYNFHGQFYTDSDELEKICNYRFIDADTYFDKQLGQLKRLSKIPVIRWLIPSKGKLKKMFSSYSHQDPGVDWMIENNKQDHIKAFFGSDEKRKHIKTFQEGYELKEPSMTQSLLNHGYDEALPASELSIKDMTKAAIYRGGECQSGSMNKGDLFTPLTWKCHYGHIFNASPNLILKGGHWCPECERDSWNFAEIAKHNPFFAQVWTPIHGNEDSVKIKKIYNDLTVEDKR